MSVPEKGDREKIITATAFSILRDDWLLFLLIGFLQDALEVGDEVEGKG